MTKRDYYKEAGDIHWQLQTWGSALRLLEAAQNELDAARAALAAVPSYVHYCQEAAEHSGFYATLDEWLAQQSEVQP